MFKFFGGTTTQADEIDYENYMLLDKRRASWLVGGIILAGALLFICGYLVGKRNAMRDFSQKVVDDSFEDQAQYALHEMYGAASAQVDSPEEPIDALAQEAATANAPGAAVAATPQPTFYAQLIGFGTLPAAEKFVGRVKKMGIPVKINKRMGKSTKNGKVITWYQVVTGDYRTEAELRAAVAPVRRAEKLGNIQVRSHSTP